jgi:hypothetical protein
MVEIGVPEPCCTMYRHLAAALGLRYWALGSETGANAFHRRALRVDVAAVVRATRTALAAAGIEITQKN